MRRTAAALALLLAASGCIPPGDPARLPPPVDAPRIDGEFETLFDESPAWEAQPARADPVPVPANRYVVRDGDTLSQIGAFTGVGLAALAEANGLFEPYAIQTGQVLIVPEGRFHRVAAGETGIAIARAYGVPWDRIVEANALEEPYVLRPGQRLAIPSAGPTPAEQARARAATLNLDLDDLVTGGEPAAAGPPPLARPALARPLPPTTPVAEPARFAGSFAWPAAGRVRNRFGALGDGINNDGIDIATAQRAPVRAAGDGVVAFAGDGVTGYGSMILIRHGEGWISAYGRTSEAVVSRGQSVRKGQLIAYGGTGAAPLLYFGLRRNRTAVDPLRFLPANPD